MSFDILDQVQSSLAVQKVNIQEFAESDEYCNPPEAPIWMADASFKPIGDIQIGDKVVGWYRKSSGIRETCVSEVAAVKRRLAPIVKVTLASGREFRCTPDHKWLTASFGGKGDGEWFCPAKVGRKLCRLIDPTPDLDPNLALRAAWLGGVFDGEGSVSAKGGSLTIAQSPTHNPAVCRAIEETLDALGFNWAASDRAYRLGIGSVRTEGVDAATSQMLTNFVNWCKPVRGTKIAGRLLQKRLWRISDEIVSIEPDGEGEVVALTTTTGNYVANGYASKNCGKPLYPRQLLFLKLMFLEELTPKEEDILDYWISGGYRGTEIEITPDIRERVQAMRDEGYSHFREVVLVGGRRSSKGFMTGIAMAKVMYDCLQLQDPGRYYQIDPTKNIMFSCIAGSEQQAQEYQFSDFSATVENCKAFQRHIINSLETEIRVATSADLRTTSMNKARGNKVKKDIARLRGKALASNAGTIRGSATMVVCIDEMAHMLEGISKASAETVYNAIEPSLDQFGIDGMMFLNSSPYTKVGLFHDKYEQGLKPMSDDGSDKRILTIRYPSWAPFEGYQGHKSKWNPRGFRKAITVSPDWDEDAKDEDGNDLYSDEDKKAIRGARSNEAAKPDVYKVERRAQFAEITDAYLNPSMVDEMFKGRPIGYDPNLRVIHEPMYTNTGDEILNIYRYKGHLDPSSTTAGFGYAIGHLEEFTMPSGESFPHVVFDKIKRWNPKDFKGGAIKWSTVMDEVMMDIRLFRPYELTLDQYQSHEPIQTLNEACRSEGLNTRVYEKVATPEVNWKRAENFKTALYQSMVHAPYDQEDHKYAALELKFLQEHRTASKYARIDHPTVGEVQTKDIADCIMEVTSALIGNILNDRLANGLSNNMMATGAPGGYRIGGPSLSERGTPMPPEIANALSRRRGEQNVFAGSQTRRSGLSIGRRRSRGIR